MTPAAAEARIYELRERLEDAQQRITFLENELRFARAATRMAQNTVHGLLARSLHEKCDGATAPSAIATR